MNFQIFSQKGCDQLNVLKAYKFRIYPTLEQQQFFIETFGCVRFTYNVLLKNREHQELREYPEEALTPAKLKQDYPFLKKTDSLALANAQRNLERAFRNYYAGRCSHPKLKTKKAMWQSYTTNNQQGTIRIENGQLKLPKIKSLVPLHQHREIKGTIKSATISAKNLEEFYVSLLCEEQVRHLPKTKQKLTIRYSPGQLLATDQQLDLTAFDQEQLKQKIAKEERRLEVRGISARRRLVKLKDAKNYQKQKKRVLALHRHKRARQEAYMDELSLLLVKEFDTIHILATPPQSTGNFSYSDWQKFLQKLTYKAHWYGKTLHHEATAKQG